MQDAACRIQSPDTCYLTHYPRLESCAPLFTSRSRSLSYPSPPECTIPCRTLSLLIVITFPPDLLSLVRLRMHMSRLRTKDPDSWPFSTWWIILVVDPTLLPKSCARRFPACSWRNNPPLHARQRKVTRLQFTRQTLTFTSCLYILHTIHPSRLIHYLEAQIRWPL